LNALISVSSQDMGWRPVSLNSLIVGYLIIGVVGVELRDRLIESVRTDSAWTSGYACLSVGSILLTRNRASSLKDALGCMSVMYLLHKLLSLVSKDARTVLDICYHFIEFWCRREFTFMRQWGHLSSTRAVPSNNIAMLNRNPGCTTACHVLGSIHAPL
jgi:hypothetical protein